MLELPKKIVVWDIETSGFSPVDDQLLEIATVTLEDNKIVDSWSMLINTEFEISEKATEINGITKEMCDKEGHPIDQVIKRFVETIEDDFHVTHNGIRFDIPFVQEQLLKQQIECDLFGKSIDTAAIFKGIRLNYTLEELMFNPDAMKEVLKIYAPNLKYNLGYCCDELGISREGVEQHRALNDALLTKDIFHRLVGV